MAMTRQAKPIFETTQQIREKVQMFKHIQSNQISFYLYPLLTMSFYFL